MKEIKFRCQAYNFSDWNWLPIARGFLRSLDTCVLTTWCSWSQHRNFKLGIGNGAQCMEPDLGLWCSVEPDLGHLYSPNLDFGTHQTWDFGTHQPWDFGTHQTWDFGTHQTWDFGTHQTWDFGAHQTWDFGYVLAFKSQWPD